MGVVVPAMCAYLLQCPSAVDLAVAGDVEMVTDVAEPAMMDMVISAGFEIQAPPLGGGGAVDNDERHCPHGATRRRLDPAHRQWRWLR